MNNNDENRVQLIPVNEINILNPRERNQAKFEKILKNISKIGLKRPITVSVRQNSNGGKAYNLICGQGRLEAFIALGEDSIPAIIKNIPPDECYLMSLVENIARRKQLPVEYIQQIDVLSERGYSNTEISRKIDANPDYVRGILQLLHHGEERLISAVENGQIPVSIAVDISATENVGAQLALLDAYQSNKLRGPALLKARDLIEKRNSRGKALYRNGQKKQTDKYSADTLVKLYQREAQRHKDITNKAKICETRLLFIVSALKELLTDENYRTLLRAENLDTMPKYLIDEINSKLDN